MLHVLTRSVVCQSCLNKLLSDGKVRILGIPGVPQYVKLNKARQLVWPEELHPNPTKKESDATGNGVDPSVDGISA